jgi:5-oxoprolinase (ATP-hydrolysing) subunit A
MDSTTIDLNCDLGESFGAYRLGHDDEVIPLISSANVACGFHAGDPHVMRHTVALAAGHGVGIGAHPGLPDLLGFGRRKMAVTPDELRDFFVYQIGALRAFVEAAGKRLQHVKLHGALLEMAVADPALARAMVEATRSVSRDLVWLTPAGLTVGAAREAGLRVVEEFYADRAYHPTKALVSRQTPGAVITDLAQIRARVVQLFETGTVTTIEGQRLPLAFESICVHGDTAGALAIIKLIRAVCAERRITIRPLGAGRPEGAAKPALSEVEGSAPSG